MQSKKTLCRNWKLYAITPDDLWKEDLLDQAIGLAISGGADVIQLRNKTISDEEFLKAVGRICKITRSRNIPLIINDRVWVAKEARADGIHLGQEDGSLAEARAMLGEDIIFGRSTHTPEQAILAQREGFDYIGVGPVFATPTKPSYTPVGLDLLRYASEHIRIPFVAIGGINEGNIKEVLRAGAKTIAVVRAIFNTKNPEEAARKFKSCWRANEYEEQK